MLGAGPGAEPWRRVPWRSRAQVRFPVEPWRPVLPRALPIPSPIWSRRPGPTAPESTRLSAAAPSSAPCSPVPSSIWSSRPGPTPPGSTRLSAAAPSSAPCSPRPLFDLEPPPGSHAAGVDAALRRLHLPCSWLLHCPLDGFSSAVAVHVLCRLDRRGSWFLPLCSLQLPTTASTPVDQTTPVRTLSSREHAKLVIRAEPRRSWVGEETGSCTGLYHSTHR